MSVPSKDSWHPPPPHQPSAPSEQTQTSQQQSSSGSQSQQAPSGLPPHQQGPHRPLGQGPYQPGQPPVLPPPRELGSGAAYYNPPSHQHPLPLPGISSASHPSYPLPGLGGSSSSSYGPASSGAQGLSQPGAQKLPPQRDLPGAQSRNQQPSQPQHSMPSTSPPTAPAPPTAMSVHNHTSPPLTSQGPQLAGIGTNQGPPSMSQASSNIQAQQQGHPLSALSNMPQPNHAQTNAQLVASAGQVAAAAGPNQVPASNAPNGPGGPILNVGPGNVSLLSNSRSMFPSGHREGDAHYETHAQKPQLSPNPISLSSGENGLSLGVERMQGLGIASSPHFMTKQGFTSDDSSGPELFANVTQDALSYLDQVKYQFQDQPDVYNKFLDIMKDFKSQAIDTPGVIDRVSTLFSGHPSLIQGFNTFLPPGYRIECSADPTDTKITVTTPNGIHHASSGENVSIAGNQGIPLSQAGLASAGGTGQPPSRFYEQQGSRWSTVEGLYGPSYAQSSAAQQHAQQQQQQGHQEAIEMARQQQMQAQAQAHAQAQAQAQHAQAQHAQQQQHQQSVQQGVSQLQTAAAHTNGTGAPKGPSTAVSTAPGPGTPGVGERGKGPVEFNHAISYVNKIKNRFSHQPEIYKNFLEILQTYQRESKPIQDVYSQVTQLFREAPDLLEDFKQFLPESAAQARAAAAAKAAAEDAANGGPMGGTPAGPASRLPAVGTFPPPPSVTKEKAKKRTGPTAAQHVDLKADAAGSGRGANKRTKVTHHKPTIDQQIANVSPTLTPFMPEPLGPPPQPMASTEELAFFDRVKKFIGNKQTYNEFLKLLNIFSQDIIAKGVLVEKVQNFIGGNRELMDWFKRFVQWEGKEETVDNTPKNQNKEAQKPCSGRDETCWEVLNDQWASHPTWASEDSGFVAHKKNQYEEILHRIEEERHDYDFNIEANLRTIQLLEPIVQRIANMTPEEKQNFRLQPGLGGQSKTIYQRIIKKVYDKEKGLEVIDCLHNAPAITVPVVLKRLKQKDEEWKAAQREWQKVWRDQTSRAFWKSLDHQGIAIKANDKKTIATKSLINDITAKYKEQSTRRLTSTTPIPDYQFLFRFQDHDIINDALRLLGVSLEHNQQFPVNDREKLETFLRSFVSLFFGNQESEQGLSVQGAEDAEDSVMEDAPSPSSVRRPRRQNTDLLRDVLKRTKGKGSRKDKEGSLPSRGSRDSSQEVHDVDVEMTSPASDSRPSIKEEGTWIHRPGQHVPGATKSGSGFPASPLDNDESGPPVKRTTFSLFGNNTIYCFFRLFQLLCDRLKSVKASEDEVKSDIEIRKQEKVADQLQISGNRVQDIFADTSATANYYSQVLDMVEKFIEGEIENTVFEESLRSVYVTTGWKLYTVDRLSVAILKLIQSIVPSEAKEKNPDKEKNADLVLRFREDRLRKTYIKERGEFQELIGYRRTVETILGPDEAVYRIDWNEETNTLTLRLCPRDAPTVSAELDKDQAWQYYVQAYMMVAPTEGVPIDRCKPVFLTRNFPTEEELSRRNLERSTTEEDINIKVCVNTFRMFFQHGGEDYIHRPSWKPVKGAEERKKHWREEVLSKLGWLKDATEEEIKAAEEELKKAPELDADVQITN